MAEKLSAYLAALCECLVGILMTVMTVVVIIGVFYRYVLGDALSWTEEMARYVMIWMCFLAASVLVREGGHIGISILRDMAPPAGKTVFLVVADIASIAFLLMWGVISVESYEIVKYDISPGVNITLGWVFASQPVCALLMLIQAVLALIRRFGPTDHAAQAERSMQEKVDA